LRGDGGFDILPAMSPKERSHGTPQEEARADGRKGSSGEALLFAVKTTTPVLVGYFAIGLVFGLLLQRAGYPWFLAPIMSATIYAGAAQYLAVGMFTSGAGLVAVAVATLLVNSRHMVYGVSLLGPFSEARRYRPYLVFSLTDETYALLTSTPIPPDLDRTKAFFFIGMLNQSYWVTASTLGAAAGSLVSIDTTGLDFALNALFMVLLIEQLRATRSRIPFVIAGACGALAYFLAGPGNMLLVSILASVVVLMFFRRRLTPNGSD